ncbi:DUF4251 domain-containing protein [Arachidicoccus sp.]|uniref:DUF4251 domain-containing protein n=1 Tax=Arachidicoccus sp. TaxID=1872624 RepID=UPI003D1D7E90
MKNYVVSTCILISLVLFACSSSLKSGVEKTEQREKIAKLTGMQNFVFEATQANPQRINILNILPNGQQLRQLSPGYYLSVTKDSIKANLPFYGRAYSGNFHSDDNGIKFSTKDFNYHLKQKRKGIYEITITLNNVKNANELILDITESGYSTLQVQSINRDIMSFYGTINSSKTDIL